ncbi:hypothetical protein MUP59_00785, partial [Candidatus Bathyarchaeota archaeon]|nr:hypothetical protein [Candidatus Bathyarchaeota archaeon]
MDVPRSSLGEALHKKVDFAARVESFQDKKVVLVTGPPGNGREEYVSAALPKLKAERKVGYYHVFEIMQEVVRSGKVPNVTNLTRENVFDIAKSDLVTIRDLAFSKITSLIKESDNDIELISTPGVFQIRPWQEYVSGRIDGITANHLEDLKPSLIIVLIDDLLRVRQQLKKDPLWGKMKLGLKELAEWRKMAIEVVQYWKELPSGWIIFAKEHHVDTFVDLVLGQKRWLYLSYHITGQKDFADIERFRKRLGEHFVCIDPYTIKDWDIVTKYDNALEKGVTGSIDITVKYSSGFQKFSGIPMKEIESAIDLIRTQIVERDCLLIANVNATVVYHKSMDPSYGVMCEVIHSATRVSRPVYVLYPFKKRLSPFFEQYVQPHN